MMSTGYAATCAPVSAECSYPTGGVPKAAGGRARRREAPVLRCDAMYIVNGKKEHWVDR
jgi:hypothetical protein